MQLSSLQHATQFSASPRRRATTPAGPHVGAHEIAGVRIRLACSLELPLGIVEHAVIHVKPADRQVQLGDLQGAVDLVPRHVGQDLLQVAHAPAGSHADVGTDLVERLRIAGVLGEHDAEKIAAVIEPAIAVEIGGPVLPPVPGLPSGLWGTGRGPLDARSGRRRGDPMTADSA